jgi:hypothetical protein
LENKKSSEITLRLNSYKITKKAKPALPDEFTRLSAEIRCQVLKRQTGHGLREREKGKTQAGKKRSANRKGKRPGV